MKIVLDSNIFVSSFFWNGNPRKVFDRVTRGYDELYITDDILNEIFDVMSREKFKLNENEIKSYLKIIEYFSKKISVNTYVESVCRDKDDNKILECAIEGNVDYIITGDKDLLVLEEYQNIKIIKPKDYLDINKL